MAFGVDVMVATIAAFSLDNPSQDDQTCHTHNRPYNPHNENRHTEHTEVGAASATTVQVVLAFASSTMAVQSVALNY